MISTTTRMRNTPASASTGQLIPPRATVPRCHAVVAPPASASRAWGCGDCGGGEYGGDDGGDAGGEDGGGWDGGGGDVGSCDVGASASGVGAGSALWTGLPQLEQNLA